MAIPPADWHCYYELVRTRDGDHAVFSVNADGVMHDTGARLPRHRNKAIAKFAVWIEKYVSAKCELHLCDGFKYGGDDS